MFKKVLLLLLLATTLSANAGQFGTFNGHIINKYRIATVEKDYYSSSIKVWYSRTECTTIPYPDATSRDNAFKSMQKWLGAN